MFYIGGVVTGMGKVSFTCCDGDLASVARTPSRPGLAPGAGPGRNLLRGPLASSGRQVRSWTSRSWRRASRGAAGGAEAKGQVKIHLQAKNGPLWPKDTFNLVRPSASSFPGCSPVAGAEEIFYETFALTIIA